MEIKKTEAVPNIGETLRNNVKLNEIIDGIDNVDDWVIYANINFFEYDTRIAAYRNISIMYNEFLRTDTVIVLSKER